MTDLTTLSERDFKRWLMERLNVNEPLTPDDDRYEPLYADMNSDPVRMLFEDIDLNPTESLNFVSGFRGSGKSTELFRLRKQLQDSGYFVAYANALDFVLPSEPVEISDFLLVLAGAFSQAIEDELDVKLGEEGFWTRFVHFLTKTEVKLDGFELKATPPGTDIGLNFKTSLREVPSFRKELRQKLAGRLGELKTQINEFFAFGRKRIQETQPDANVVFIFDQFEQIRDTTDTGGRVAESVTSLIANHRQHLTIPFTHVILTVPPWLKLRLSQFRNVRLMYNVKLWNNNEERTPVDAGWETMRQVIKRRFTEPGMTRFFGEPSSNGKYKYADMLINASGGHFRDLILLLRECLLGAKQLPVTEQTAKSAIYYLRDSFLPISLTDAKLLHDIGQRRDCLLEDSSSENIHRMTMFLDTHIALILKNGEEWYDVHPLVRDDIAEIVKRKPAEE